MSSDIILCQINRHLTPAYSSFSIHKPAEYHIHVQVSHRLYGRPPTVVQIYNFFEISILCDIQVCLQTNHIYCLNLSQVCRKFNLVHLWSCPVFLLSFA